MNEITNNDLRKELTHTGKTLVNYYQSQEENLIELRNEIRRLKKQLALEEAKMEAISDIVQEIPAIKQALNL